MAFFHFSSLKQAASLEIRGSFLGFIEVCLHTQRTHKHQHTTPSNAHSHLLSIHHNSRSATAHSSSKTQQLWQRSAAGTAAEAHGWQICWTKWMTGMRSMSKCSTIGAEILQQECLLPGGSLTAHSCRVALLTGSSCKRIRHPRSSTHHRHNCKTHIGLLSTPTLLLLCPCTSCCVQAYRVRASCRRRRSSVGSFGSSKASLRMAQ
jgi:hypothetical protein